MCTHFLIRSYYLGKNKKRFFNYLLINILYIHWLTKLNKYFLLTKTRVINFNKNVIIDIFQYLIYSLS